MKFFGIKGPFSIFCISLMFSTAALCAQENAEEQPEVSEKPPAPARSERMDHVRSAMAELPFADVASEDMRSFERRHLIREISKRLSEYADIVEALAGRLDEIGYTDVDSLLAEKFAFVNDTSSKTFVPAAPPVPEKVAQAPKAPEQPKIEEPKEEPASRTRSRRRGTEEKNNNMPVSGNDGTFDAKEGILIVKSSNSTATAFVAEINGKNFIVTNLHVASDTGITFWTVNGKLIQTPSAGFAAEGRDLYIMPLASVPDGVKVLPISENVASEVRDGDEAMICGNAQGGGVLLVAHGSVVAIGPDVIETDCSVFKGNSGSPMYHKKSGKIIGTVSHARSINDELSRATRSMSNSPIKRETRYFGVRMDTVGKWYPLSPAEAASQCSDLEAFANKARCGIEFRGHQRNVIVSYNYPEFERLIDRYRSIGNTGRGGTMERKVLYEMYTNISHLMNNEAAKLRTGKYSEAFKADVDALIEAFIYLKDFYSNEARRYK